MVFPATAIRIAAVLAWFSVAVQATLAFGAPGYNWDLDHEMYFGARLLAGELIWTREFHDKLPFMQVLFAVPAWAGSIEAWRAISLGLCLGAALALVKLGPRAFDMGGLPRTEARWVAALAGGLYCAFSLALPGGISVVNPAAGSLALIGTLAVLADLRPGAARRGRTLAAGALVLAAAISLRPYFAAPVALAVAWGAARCAWAARRAATDALIRALLWCGGIGLWALVLNAGPYLLSGELAALRYGLAALGADLYGWAPWPRFVKAIRGASTAEAALWLSLAAGAALFLVMARPNGRGAAGVLYVLAGAVVLLAFTVSQRWWSHYAHFLSGSLALLVVTLGAWLAAGRQWRWAVRAAPLVFGAWAVLLATGFAGLALHDIAAEEAGDDGRAAILAAFEGYRARPGRAELPFLAPAQIFLHWKLHEPRHGFPQSANTGHIARGWWAGLPKATWIAMPRSPRAYCDLLLAEGPALVVVTRFDWLVPCLERAASPYRLDAALPLPEGDTMRVYMRGPG